MDQARLAGARQALASRKGIKRLLLGSETQHALTFGTVPVRVLR